MGEKTPYRRVDPDQLEEIRRAERPPLRIRWWVLIVAVVLSAAQAIICLFFEHTGKEKYLIATQISIIAFAFFGVLTLVVNRLLRLTRILKPLNRGELMAIFAALFVSAGIASFGLADQLVPLVAAPFNSQWNDPQAGWDRDVIPHLNRDLFITDPKVIEEFREGFGTYEGLWGKIPWWAWAKPLGFWLIFVFAMYLMFYSLSMLLYDTWARREKLVFPLARLPEDLMHDEGAAPGSLPSTMRSGLFWVGFLFVFLLLSYNGAAQARWLGDMKPLHMGLERDALKDMLSNSVFHGIVTKPGESQYGLSFTIIFTAIGIGFLLPLQISFSLWFYRLVNLFLFLIAIWCAVGSSLKAFPSEWMWENNFVSSLGAGGLLAFAAVCLFKLVREHWQTRSSTMVTPEQRRISQWAVLLFVISVLVAAMWLQWSGVSILWGFSFLAVIILVTVGLMRVVAEGGVYWFQIDAGPLHLARLFGGVKTFGAAVLAPLMSVCWVLFLDIKTFMAPSVLNSLKMQDETRASRRRFHLTVVLSILVTVFVSLVVILYVAYAKGANQTSGWFFTGGPKGLFVRTQKVVTGKVGLGGVSDGIFYLIGAGWVILSIVMRRRFFWWLHPIGFVMMANPLMSPLWFPFFIGWLCKRFAVKYGGRYTYARLRPIFIGLILGEVAACFLWAILAKWLSLPGVAIDINRFEP